VLLIVKATVIDGAAITVVVPIRLQLVRLQLVRLRPVGVGPR
jgi:hypothetical protein